MLIEAAGRTEGVAQDTAPQVFQTALNDWYPVYRLVCHATPTEPRPRALLLSALHANIQDVFNTYGVQIMSPQYVMTPEKPSWFLRTSGTPHLLLSPTPKLEIPIPMISFELVCMDVRSKKILDRFF